MKCINKVWINRITAVFAIFVLMLSLCGCSLTDKQEEEVSEEEHSYELFCMFNSEEEVLLTPYTVEKQLCVTAGDVERNGYSTDDMNAASGLFDVNGREVLEAYNCFEKMYPASTTKLMTAYLTLINGNLEDEVTVSESAMELDPDSSVCGLEVGDVISVKDLLYGLLLASGNDAANVLAEYIGGTISEFVNMMNSTAESLLMSGTHFMNPHGLHDDNHYTTVYDLYIIMNECIKIDTFNTIIDTPEYTGQVLHNTGNYQMFKWYATNYYFQGFADMPTSVTVMGGKTGTTDEAGPCLVLLSRDDEGNPYISVIMNSYNKPYLYSKMTELLETIN